MEKEKSLMQVALEKAESVLNKVKAHLSEEKPTEEVKLQAEAVKDDGAVVYTDADEFAPAVSVFVQEGEEILPAPDGEHRLEDGRVLVVADGAVESIEEAGEEEMEEELETEEQYVTRTEFAEFAQGLYDALNLASQELSEMKKESAKAEELEAKLSEVTKEKEEAEQKLSKTPAVPSVKKTQKEKQPVTLSKEEIALMPPKERIKLFRDHPELQPKTK